MPLKRSTVVHFGKTVVFLCKYCSHLRLVIGRGQSGFFMEHTGEMRFFVLAQLKADFRNCFIRVY